MAYLPDQRHWFYVSFALKDSTGATTTINCSNSAEIDDGSTYYPILKGISGVSADMGAYMPLTQGGTIVLDNSPGSFGYERRFSDLLDRLRIIDTEIVIYGARTAIDDTGIVDGFTQIYKARVQRWAYDVEGDSLSIQIAGAPIRKQVLTKVVDSVSFPSAPTASLGRHLPVVIGSSVEVQAVRIDADGDASPSYAFATTLSDDFISGGIQTYYAKDTNGEFQAVVGVSNVNTAFNTYTFTGSGTPWLLYSHAQLIDLDPADTYIATHIDMNFKGVGATGAYTEGMRISICTFGQQPEAGPTELGGVTILKSNYRTQMQASAEFTITAAFEHPVVLSSAAMQYYVVVEQSYNLTDVEYMSGVYNATPQTIQGSFREALDPSSQWSKPASFSTSELMKFELYGVKFTETTSTAGDADGLGHASFELTQKSAPTYYTNPDLTELEFVVATDGLKDDGSGSVTGSASSLIERPDHALMLLDKEWDGAAWDGASGRVDDTKYSATHAALDASTNRYYRKVAGRTDGRATVEQIVEEVAKNSGVRLALANSTTAGKSLGVYVWGEEISSSATFTDENSRVLSIEQRGTETIVNRVAMYFDRRLRDLDIVTGSAEGGFRNYAQMVNWTDGTNSIATALCSESQTVFGVRPLAESAFDWLNDSASAEVMAAYFMSLYGKPHSYVTVEVPMFSAETLDVLNVITIIHPALSAYFGTSSLAKAPSYGGDPGDPGLGQYLKRAKSYRAQIEGKSLYFNLGDIPTIRLTCRILDNYPTDPT